MKPTTVLCILSWLILGSSAEARSPYLHPNIAVTPAAPDPGAEFTLRITDVTGVRAIVDESSIEVSGSTITITASLTLGTYSTSQGYHITKPVPPLAAGPYAIRYIARIRQTGVEYDEPYLYGAWPLSSGVAPIALSIEYFNNLLQHYFMTADANEIDTLDRGIIAGWQRTGQFFGVEPTGTLDTSANNVCRYTDYLRPV